jgi:hypothetical protein
MQEMMMKQKRNLIKDMYKNTSLTFALGGLEKAPKTGNTHMQCCFFFRDQVHFKTLIPYLKNFQ